MANQDVSPPVVTSRCHDLCTYSTVPVHEVIFSRQVFYLPVLVYGTPYRYLIEYLLIAHLVRQLNSRHLFLCTGTERTVPGTCTRYSEYSSTGYRLVSFLLIRRTRVPGTPYDITMRLAVSSYQVIKVLGVLSRSTVLVAPGTPSTVQVDTYSATVGTPSTCYQLLYCTCTYSRSYW